MTHGVYLVTGAQAYRGHKPGQTFWARLERAAEAFVEYERNPGRYLRIVIDSGAG